MSEYLRIFAVHICTDTPAHPPARPPARTALQLPPLSPPPPPEPQGYRGYYEQLLRLVRPGGVIAVDNVLWYGRVADPGMEGDGATAALRELNAFLLGDPRVAFSLVPVGDGMALCTKR